MSGPFSTAIVQAGGHNTLDDEQACSCRERMTLSTHPSLHPFIIHIPIYASLHPPTNHPLSTHPPIQLFILSYSHPPTHHPSIHPPTQPPTILLYASIHPTSIHLPIHLPLVPTRSSHVSCPHPPHMALAQGHAPQWWRKGLRRLQRPRGWCWPFTAWVVSVVRLEWPGPMPLRSASVQSLWACVLQKYRPRADPFVRGSRK